MNTLFDIAATVVVIVLVLLLLGGCTKAGQQEASEHVIRHVDTELHVACYRFYWGTGISCVPLKPSADAVLRAMEELEAAGRAR
jgi:uncharacterized protein YcfL